MKYALVFVSTRAVAQWQDHEQLSYAEPAEGYALHELPDDFDCEQPTAGWYVVEGELTTYAPELPTLPAGVPQIVTMRQARLALLAAGKLDEVDAAIESLPAADRSVARIEWDYGGTVERSSPIVAMLADALGLDDATLDALFVDAASK